MYLKAFLTIMILTFTLQSWTKADDISDFQIEGMSIGDSALDYFSEIDINSFYRVDYNDDKFYLRESTDEFKFKFEIYDSITFHVKKNDKNLIMHALGARKFFPNREKECKTLKSKIISSIQDVVKNLKKDSYRSYYKGLYKGKSYADVTEFSFKNGSFIRLWCVNWSKIVEKEKRWIDNLTIAFNTKEFYTWVTTKAHK